MVNGYLSLKSLSHCHEFSYDMRRVNNSPHIVGKSKRCPLCRTLSPYLVYCRGVPDILNGSKILPVLGVQSGRSDYRTDLATRPYNVVHLSYSFSPIVVRPRHPKTVAESPRVHYG